ncbi:MAG: MBL fold metallo-hydrolase [Candidatus Diapherotrites archaeon]|nr:MBL fold metallo-hydrolase [Candidatus Diapherotrites archaeon]
MGFKIIGMGACREVGRSSFLLDAGDKILLDRGIKLTPERVEYPLPVNTRLDAVIISHAHLDHSGDLPRLFTKNTPVAYMTPATLDLAEMLWHDSLKIAGIEGTDAKFSKVDIRRTRKYTFPVSYRAELEITEKVTMQFFDAGHIVGSAITKLSFDDVSLVYTGDFKVEETRLLNKADIKIGEADYVIIESTYGDKDHPNRRKVEREFVEACLDVVENRGFAIVPAFAVGRSHEIVDILAEYGVKHPIYLDGMAQKAANITLKYPNYLKDAKTLKRALRKAHWIRNERERKRALKEPAIIVTTAGMCDGGPVLNYIKRLHNDEKSAIFLTGYQVEGTQGRRLLEEGVITIDGKEYRPKCTVRKFDFSAHPGQSEMLRALRKWNPQEVFLVHGEPEKVRAFQNKIKEELGIDAHPLEFGKTVKVGER